MRPKGVGYRMDTLVIDRFKVTGFNHSKTAQSSYQVHNTQGWTC